MSIIYNIKRTFRGICPPVCSPSAAFVSFKNSKEFKLFDLDLNMSEEIFATLASKYACELDTTGSIGKRYRKQDEIGTPICITIDVDSVTDQKVTVRDRDSLKQVRVSFKEIEQASLEDLLKLFR